MIFNWEQFFTSQGIEYHTSGKNVKNGNANINCIFCGNDTGFHLGCDLATGVWGCWKSREHRGRNPAKLVQRLLNCSWSEACKITGGDNEITPGIGTLEDLERQSELLTVTRINTGQSIIRFPPEFREIKSTGITSVAYDYLIDRRGYREKDVERLCKDYRLRYAITGEMKQRIILPFLHKQLAIIGWQGRAVGESRTRYLTHPASIKETLFNYGYAMEGGWVLVIVEGPHGSLNIDFHGRKHGIRSVAVAGVGFTEKQVAAIYKLAPRFEKVLVLFDPGANDQASDLCSRLSRFGASQGELPDGVDGPDDLPNNDVVDFVMESLR